MALADAGDPVALAAVSAAAQCLGRTVAGLAGVIDPDVVVVGGGLAHAGPTWWNPLVAALRHELPTALEQLPVVPAQLGSWAPVIGAARPVNERLQTLSTTGRAS